MRAFAAGFLPATLVQVLSNAPQAGVLEAARAHQVPCQCVPSAGRTRQAHEAALLQALGAQQVDHLLLAGYMRLLSPEFLAAFKGTVLNIHPSLLPEFPGLHAARRQAQAGRKVVGATVHVVDAGVDTGPILLQGSLVAEDGESEDVTIGRILAEVEHVIYPRAVRLFLDRVSHANF
jgi:phosphoribosylglycinamide formyltransferase-1